MSPVALSTLLALAAATSAVLAFTPLADKRFSYPDGIPYQADTDDDIRGPQFGYHKCNSTTEGSGSLCQTAFLNHLDDWCVWAPSKPNSAIGDTEGEEVAWCTKKGRGTRIIPPGAITGVQFMKTPGYLQIVGFIDQTKINIAGDDSGGELDPHGEDLRGNPLGGLVYSNGFASNNGNNDTFQQVIEWHNFMGSNSFCFKVCDPADPHAPHLCQHIYERIGVLYNCPTAAQDGVFESCEGNNQDPPGVFTDAAGKVQTYRQPPESSGPITSMPYEPKIPKSSNCVSFASSALFADLPAVTGGGTTTGATTTTGTGTGTTKPTSTGTSSTRTGASSGPSATGGASDGNNGAASEDAHLVARHRRGCTRGRRVPRISEFSPL